MLIVLGYHLLVTFCCAMDLGIEETYPELSRADDQSLVQAGDDAADYAGQELPGPPPTQQAPKINKRNNLKNRKNY